MFASRYHDLFKLIEAHCRANDVPFTASTISKLFEDEDFALRARRALFLPGERRLPHPMTILRKAESTPAFRMGRSPELIKTLDEYETALPYIHKTHRRPTLKRIIKETIQASPHRYTLEEWANRTGLSISTIRRYRGDAPKHSTPASFRTTQAREAIMSNPYADTRAKLAEQYEVSPAYVSLIRRDLQAGIDFLQQHFEVNADTLPSLLADPAIAKKLRSLMGLSASRPLPAPDVFLNPMQKRPTDKYAAAREAIKANPYADSISNLAHTYGISRALVSKIRKEAASK